MLIIKTTELKFTRQVKGEVAMETKDFEAYIASRFIQEEIAEIENVAKVEHESP